jgi:apolipoprotein N-acyltransferase
MNDHPLPTSRAWLLAVLSGLLLYAAFPLPGWWPLGWMALAPLIVGAARSGPWTAALLGLAAGMLANALAMPWLITVMKTYGGLSLLVSLLLYLLLVLYLSLYTSAFALTVSLLCRRGGPDWVLLAPVAWVGAELLRGTLITGFPWNLLAYTQAAVPAAIQPAAVVGAYGLSLILALSSALLARGALGSGHQRWPGGSKALPAWAWPGLALALVLLVLGGGQARIAVLDARVSGAGQTPRLEAAMIQCNVAQEMKMSARERVRIAELLYDLTREAGSRGPLDLVIWPEASIPFLRFRNEPVFRGEIEALAREIDAPILFGTVDSPAALDETYRPGGRGRGEYTNAAMMLDRRGQLTFKYDKIHLVPFGEYVPARQLLFFAGKLVAEVADFTPGKSYAITRLGAAEGGCLICYEIIFPGLVRSFVRSGADVLVTITNDAWFGDSAAPRQHFNAAVLRAVENGRLVLRCANTGISGVIDPLGRVLERTRLNERVIVPVSQGVTPLDTFYSRHGEVTSWGCLVIWAAALVTCRARRGRPRGGRDTTSAKQKGARS